MQAKLRKSEPRIIGCNTKHGESQDRSWKRTRRKDLERWGKGGNKRVPDEWLIIRLGSAGSEGKV